MKRFKFFCVRRKRVKQTDIFPRQKMEFDRVNMNPASKSPAPIRQTLTRSSTAPPTKTFSRRSLSTSPPPSSAPYTTKYNFFMNNNNNNEDYEGGTGHVHRSNQRRAYNSRYMTDTGSALRPILSQQQAEARNLMLNEIKALQLRRQGSFKRMLRLPYWGSGIVKLL